MVRAFAALNGSSLPLGNLLHYCFGTPEPTSQPALSPINLPDVPVDEFSEDWLVQDSSFASRMYEEFDDDDDDEERWKLGYDVLKLSLVRRRLFDD